MKGYIAVLVDSFPLFIVQMASILGTVLGEFCPLKTLSGKPEVGSLQETSGQTVVLEMNFVDTGYTAALVKHKVVDNKLHVSLICKDIVCNSVYTKL